MSPQIAGAGTNFVDRAERAAGSLTSFEPLADIAVVSASVTASISATLTTAPLYALMELPSSRDDAPCAGADFGAGHGGRHRRRRRDRGPSQRRVLETARRNVGGAEARKAARSSTISVPVAAVPISSRKPMRPS
jgi:hypothetical protein